MSDMRERPEARIGKKGWTAREADARELVHDLAVRVSIKARRALRMLSPMAPHAEAKRQHLLEIISSTQRLRKADSLDEFRETLAKLREDLRQIDSDSPPDVVEGGRE